MTHRRSESRKNKIWYVVVAAFSAIVLSVSVAVHLYNRNQRGQEFTFHVELDGEGVNAEALTFTSLPLFPGDSCEYTLGVEAKESGTYALAFAFEKEAAQNSALAEWVTVSLCEEENIIGEQTLQEAFLGEPLTATLEMSEGETVTFVFRYVLPIEAGDELQGATADFNVLLTAKSV